jgi:predicted methyltransferase
MRFRPRDVGVTALLCITFLAGVTLQAAVAQDYNAIVAASDRSDADRQTDKRREPAKLLAFTGVRSGMKVLDIGAGGGYSTELMARAVGPTGVVYAQNAEPVNERAKQTYDNRAKTPAMKNVVQVLRKFDDPAPPEAKDLDLITFFFAYHDTTFMPSIAPR